jgi:hypothetical protein
MQPYNKQCDEYCECDECSTIHEQKQKENNEIKIALGNKRYVVCKTYGSFNITPSLTNYSSASNALFDSLLSKSFEQDIGGKLMFKHEVIGEPHDRKIERLSFYICERDYFQEITFAELYQHMLEEVSIIKLSVLNKLNSKHHA